jgi:membrane protease YdiL (CAAX protease family)
MRVFLAGLGFTLIYLLSYSLLNAVIVHAAVDLGSGGLIWYARQKAEGRE